MWYIKNSVSPLLHSSVMPINVKNSVSPLLHSSVMEVAAALQHMDTKRQNAAFGLSLQNRFFEEWLTSPKTGRESSCELKPEHPAARRGRRVLRTEWQCPRDVGRQELSQDILRRWRTIYATESSRSHDHLLWTHPERMLHPALHSQSSWHIHESSQAYPLSAWQL